MCDYALLSTMSSVVQRSPCFLILKTHSFEIRHATKQPRRSVGALVSCQRMASESRVFEHLNRLAIKVATYFFRSCHNTNIYNSVEGTTLERITSPPVRRSTRPAGPQLNTLGRQGAVPKNPARAARAVPKNPARAARAVWMIASNINGDSGLRMAP